MEFPKVFCAAALLRSLALGSSPSWLVEEGGDPL